MKPELGRERRTHVIRFRDKMCEDLTTHDRGKLDSAEVDFQFEVLIRRSVMNGVDYSVFYLSRAFPVTS